jgi:trigger factor
MQVKTTHPSDTQAKLSVTADEPMLRSMKDHVLTHFRSRVKIAGFRPGTAPLNLIEKHIDPAELQTEFLEETISSLYSQAIQQERLRPVDRPEISIIKFVPFTTLEFEASVPVVGEIKLPEYTKIKKSKVPVTVTTDDVKDVLTSLRQRMADKKDVNRAARDGDQVWIDFKGIDDKGEAVNGAEGKDYPLILGSNTFIPGFEPNLAGLSAGEEKTFTLKFPKDYGVKALANRNVTFTVTVTKVQEVVEPKADDEFAAKAGPFKTLKDLKDDIKRQLQHERQHEADRNYESELIKTIADKSKVTIPDVLINDQVERLIADLRQNLMYRGMTWEEYLEAEGKSEEAYRTEVLIPQARERVKASLVLAEIAEQEKLEVTPEELEVRMQILKGQYQDAAMQAELDKPEARQDIAARLLTEKTVAKLVTYATQ